MEFGIKNTYFKIMRLKIYIFIFFSFFSVNLFAKIDINSMLNRLNSVQNIDKIKLLNDISTYYFIIDDSVNFHKYGYLALDISQKLQDKKLEVDALNQFAFINSYKDRKLNLKYGNLALELANSIDYQDGIAYAYFNIAYANKRADLAQKIDFYLKSINLAQKIHNNFVSAIANTFLGEIYSSIDNYSEATKYLINAQRFFDKIYYSDTTLRTRYIYGEMLNCMGITYKKMANYSEAEKFYKMYKDNSIKISNSYGIAIAHNNLGIIYYRIKDFQKSIYFFKTAKEEFEKNGIEGFSGTIFNNLGNIYYELKEFDKVETNYQLALEFSRKKNDSILQGKILANLADLRLVQKKYTESISLLMQSLKLVKNQDNDIKMNCFLGLATIYDSLKQSKISYKYFKLYTELKDSIASITKSDEIGMLTENYKNEKIVEEQKRQADLNQKIELEKQQRKYNLQYIGILIFLLMFFAYILFVGKHKLSVTKIESIIFVALLFLFQFIQVLMDPYINNITDGEPIYNVFVYSIIAVILIPLDTFSEKILRKKTILKVSRKEDD
jgi:tetratricopeptide (TPR) repeat protein